MFPEMLVFICRCRIQEGPKSENIAQLPLSKNTKFFKVLQNMGYPRRNIQIKMALRDLKRNTRYYTVKGKFLDRLQRMTMSVYFTLTVGSVPHNMWTRGTMQVINITCQAEQP
jgi:hypothetical protein